MRWSREEITAIELEPGMSEGDTVTIRIATPSGQVRIMGDIDVDGRVLLVRGAHIQSASGANTIGIANLRVIAQLVLERIDCDEARVEGADRTTGANPGHRPRVLRFTHRPGD